jgi:hypothetical protein
MVAKGPAPHALPGGDIPGGFQPQSVAGQIKLHTLAQVVQLRQQLIRFLVIDHILRAEFDDHLFDRSI